MSVSSLYLVKYIGVQSMNLHTINPSGAHFFSCVKGESRSRCQPQPKPVKKERQAQGEDVEALIPGEANAGTVPISKGGEVAKNQAAASCLRGSVGDRSQKEPLCMGSVRSVASNVISKASLVGKFEDERGSLFWLFYFFPSQINMKGESFPPRTVVDINPYSLNKEAFFLAPLR